MPKMPNKDWIDHEIDVVQREIRNLEYQMRIAKKRLLKLEAEKSGLGD